MNSCIAPPSVWMGGEREREKVMRNERKEGRSGERERFLGGGGGGVEFLTAGCTSARQSSNSKMSSALHLSCCVIR